MSSPLKVCLHLQRFCENFSNSVAKLHHSACLGWWGTKTNNPICFASAKKVKPSQTVVQSWPFSQTFCTELRQCKHSFRSHIVITYLGWGLHQGKYCDIYGCGGLNTSAVKTLLMWTLKKGSELSFLSHNHRHLI